MIIMSYIIRIGKDIIPDQLHVKVCILGKFVFHLGNDLICDIQKQSIEILGGFKRKPSN